MLAAIGHHEGVVLLTGDVGTGKTTLCRAIARQLDDKTPASFISTACLSFDDLLANVLLDFGVAHDFGVIDADGSPHRAARRLALGLHFGASQRQQREMAKEGPTDGVELTATLGNFMRSLESLGSNALVLIDDAHSLPIEVLENIPALSEAGNGASRLQIILIGRPDLVTLVERSELKSLAQHISQRSVLGPLAANEIEEYIEHRLRATAAARATMRFDERALFVIYELTGGVPKTVNDICDRALSRASQTGLMTIDSELVESCSEDLSLTDLKDRQRPHALGMIFVLGLAVVWILLVGVGAAGAMWVFQGAVERTITRWETLPQPPARPAIQAPIPIVPVEPPMEH